MFNPLRLFSYLIPAFCYCLPVFGQLHAEFSSDKTGGCRPLLIHFTDQTAGVSSNAIYEWDLGNGNTSHLASPEAVYVNEGDYTVTVTVKDGNQSSKATHTITVFLPPVVGFSGTPGTACVGIPVTFASTATAGSGTITSYLWDFGDGVTLQGGDHPTHAYQHEGQATVSLTVTNSNGCSSNLEKAGLIRVLPQVTAGWSADKQVLCNVTDPIQFTNHSTGTAPLTYLWDFGDGHTSTQADPAYSFSQKGNYTVKLTTTSADGCSATVTQTDPLNVANYNTDFDLPASGCSGAGIDITDKSAPASDSRVWQIDGTDAGTATPQPITLPGAGVHTVRLTSVFGACSQSSIKQITVVPSPALTDFDIDVQGKCGAPVTVDFTDHTTGAVSWDWNFNYDPTDPFPNIVHQGPSTSYQLYTNYKNYSIQLKVTNANGCSSSLVKTVMVQPPVVYIDEVNSPGESSCNKPITKTYEIQDPANLQSWQWDFGDGTTSTALSPTHTFTAIGEYSTLLHYTTKDGCTGVANGLNTIVAKPLNVDFSLANTTVCANSNFLMDASSLYLSDALWYSFEYGDGTPSSFYPQHIYTTPGVYTVTMHAENAACDTTVTKTNYITVLPPVGAYTGFDNTCDGLRNVVTFHFTPGSATQLVWDFGDGSTQTTDGSISSLQHTYAASGYYPMTVSGGNTYCAVSGSDQVFVLMKQHPALTTDQAAICPDGILNVSVSDYEQNPRLYPSTNHYSLNFQYGDSTDFLGQVSTPYYAGWGNSFVGSLTNFQGGESGIRLITTSVYFGCNDTTDIVPLNIKGVSAGYEIVNDHLCFQSPVVLKDTSKVSIGNSILSWRWDFGDGQTSAQSGTVSHNYANPGSYLVRLTVQDASGCNSSSSSAVTQVAVNGPKASFSPSATDVRLNTMVVFTNSTQDFGSHPDWSWDFGDNTGSTDPNPTHQYTQAGAYIVTLTATDPVTGCNSTATTTIVVDPFGANFTVNASYVAQGHCPPLLVQFTNNSENFTSVHWDFGDGSVADDLNTPSHVYEQAGEYTVTLTVSGANNLSAQYVLKVEVDQPAATLSADVSALCAGGTVALKATATGAVDYAWDFGDGSVGDGADPDITHVYQGGGNYVIKLLATDPDGCTMAADVGVGLQVHPPPDVTITPAAPIICLNSSVTLQATGGGAYSWAPATGLDRNDVGTPIAAPTVNTSYQVTVTDNIGCHTERTVDITVIQPLTVSVTPQKDSVCPGGIVQMKASGAYSYLWIDNISGLDNTQAASVIASPPASGVYTVTGTDAQGCFSDTAEVKVTVLPVPSVNAGADVEVLVGANIDLNATGSSDIVNWAWSPSQYLSCTGCENPVATPQRTMQYVVTATNKNGCSASDTVIVRLACDAARVGVPNAFSPNGDGHNDRLVIMGIGEVDHMVIYDRWGDRVFERNHFNPADPSNCWDGRFRGQPADTGVYTYFIEMRCPVGGVFTMRGTVILVR